MPDTDSTQDTHDTAARYWKAKLVALFVILAIWFVVSFGCGILFRESLDQFSIGKAPLGFWMAQQGSIICFVVLLIVYAIWMNALDSKFGFAEKEGGDA